MRTRFFRYPSFVPVIFLLLLLYTCGGSPNEVYYLPEILPTEEAIKETLSSDSQLALLHEKAKSKHQSLEEWKESERSFVTEKDINVYWPIEKRNYLLRSKIPMPLTAYVIRFELELCGVGCSTKQESS